MGLEKQREHIESYDSLSWIAILSAMINRDPGG